MNKINKKVCWIMVRMNENKSIKQGRGTGSTRDAAAIFRQADQERPENATCQCRGKATGLSHMDEE